MKKKVKIVIIILLIVVLAVCAWFIGYHTRKSQDNLPSLESIAEMNEADINDLLVGYRNYQLDDVWEDPDKQTGVNYLYHASGYSGGVTPLLDRDGKPIISPVINR